MLPLATHLVYFEMAYMRRNTDGGHMDQMHGRVG